MYMLNLNILHIKKARKYICIYISEKQVCDCIGMGYHRSELEERDRR